MSSIPAHPFSALEIQKQVFLRGVSGARPLVPLAFDDLEQAARERMSAKGFAYVAGGAGTETTMQQNRLGFQRYSIQPRMLRDVGSRDTRIQLFGKSYPAPFLLAPIGVLDLAHRKGDLLTAEAAGNLGIPMVFSNQASASMESMSAVMGNGPRWFQLYWSKSNELVESLVRRAENCGCEAIVLTLDTTMLGWRPRDLALGYLPFLEGRGIGQYTSDPVFHKLMQMPQVEDPNAPKRKLTLQTIRTLIQLLNNYPGNKLENMRSGKPLKAVRTFINVYNRPSLTFEDLPFLRNLTKLPILLKGILHPDDARRAIGMGIDGLVISNHGGRQVDGAVSSIEVLPSIVEAVGEQTTILLDSGIRSGADIFKALALGAQGVLLGRPFVYGLAVAGKSGVEAVLRHTLADFELNMGLAGCRNIAEVRQTSLVKNF